MHVNKLGINTRNLELGIVTQTSCMIAQFSFTNKLRVRVLKNNWITIKSKKSLRDLAYELLTCLPTAYLAKWHRVVVLDVYSTKLNYNN